MKRILMVLCLALFSAQQARADLIVTEVGPDSTGAEPATEYAVIFNQGPSAQDLTGWMFDDIAGGSAPASLAGTLNAGSYLVISPSDQLTLEMTWSQSIPVGTSYFQTGSWPTLNNGGDTARLLDDSSVEQFSAAYTDANAGVGRAVPSDVDITPFSTISAVPEPSSLALVAFGVVGLATRRRRG